MHLPAILSLFLSLPACRDTAEKEAEDTSPPTETASPSETGVQPDTSAGTGDSGDSGDSGETTDPPPPLLAVSFTSPTDMSGYYDDEPEPLTGLVSHPDGGDLSEAVIGLSSSADGDIPFDFDPATGEGAYLSAAPWP